MNTDSRMGCLKLAAGCLILSLLWLWGMPQLAKLPIVKQHIDFLEDRNINTGAMFYTEVQDQR
jgi:hypothetical protein